MENAKVSLHYDERYYAWQQTGGEFGGWANLTKFSAFVSRNDDVLDFGCGGGWLLRRIDCRKRVGVEPNLPAAETAKQNGIEIYRSTRDVPDEYVDIVISNNALEHTLQPLDELKSLYPKLRGGGKAVFVVPCESISCSYKPKDINHHLYSWSPMCIGNLFTEAGYQVVESKPYIHKWPPGFRYVAKVGGRGLFEMACRTYGRIARSWFQVRVIAVKPRA